MSVPTTALSVPSTARPKFGVIGTEFEGEYMLTVLQGLHSSAIALDIDLVIYSVLRTGAPNAFARQFTVNYGFIDASVLDGLIILGANLASYALETGTLEQLKSRFEHIPSVVLGCTVGDWPSVTCDGYIGFKQVVEHLITVHGQTRIAMLEGSENSADAKDRLQAYLDAHREAGLVPDPKLRRKAEFLYAPARLAFKDLVESGAPFKAVVCANDNMAWGCIAGALELGMSLPDDMIVCGFDDIHSYTSSRPSLTSVNQILEKQGEAAVQMLHARYHGRATERHVHLPARMVIRRSCGCLDLGATGSQPHGDDLRAYCRELFNELNLPQDMRAALGDELLALQAAVTSADVDTYSEITFARLFRLWQMQNLSGTLLRSLLLGLQTRLLANLSPAVAALAAQRIQRAQLQIAIAADVVGNLEHKMLDNTKNLHLTFKTRITSDDLTALLSGLAEGLKELTVTTCFISLYQRPVTFDAVAEEGLPSTSRLVFALDGGALHPEWCGEEYSTCELLPPVGLRAERAKARTLMSFPLFHLNEHFGFVVFEWRRQERFSYEELRHEISSSLHHSLLVRELDAAKELLRMDLERAKAANENLSHIAMRDAMTGLFNRRGFLQLAESVMRTARLTGQTMSIIFADMDGLKHINDVYGHEEGDAAICQAGRVLQQAFRTEDIVSRIGGDEFVVLTRSGVQDSLDLIEQRVGKHFAEYNATGTKPYSVNCSLGGYLVPADSTESLDEILSHADRMMYAEKRRRRSLKNPLPPA
ncbi:MAG: GGDEF domain-containing protein [Pseudomonadota bacterium]